MSERGYEAADLADRRRPVVVGFALICAVVSAGFVAAWVAQGLLGGALAADTQQEGAPGDVIRAQRRVVEAEWAADAVAWTWRAPGVATIPVARAAAHALARGFPTRPGLSRPLPARGAR